MKPYRCRTCKRSKTEDEMIRDHGKVSETRCRSCSLKLREARKKRLYEDSKRVDERGEPINNGKNYRDYVAEAYGPGRIKSIKQRYNI